MNANAMSKRSSARRDASAAQLGSRVLGCQSFDYRANGRLALFGWRLFPGFLPRLLTFKPLMMTVVMALLAGSASQSFAQAPDLSMPNFTNSPLLRKFVDGLPGLTAANKNNLNQYIPVAIPDTASYPGSDYYEIELGEYREQMHSDLPATGTKLRGYRQTNTGDPTVSAFHYLGPLIIAQRNRPVRVKFTNKLPTGAGGDLFIPVDTTLDGAGAVPQGITRLHDHQRRLGLLVADGHHHGRRRHGGRGHGDDSGGDCQ